MPIRTWAILIVLDDATTPDRVFRRRKPLPTLRCVVTRWSRLSADDLERRRFDGILCQTGGREPGSRRRMARLRRLAPGLPLLRFSLSPRSARRKTGRAASDSLVTPIAPEVIDSILAREQRIAQLERKTSLHALRMRQQGARLKGLAAVVRATGKELEPRRIVELAMDQVSRFLKLQAWIFFLLDAEQGLLMVEQTSGEEMDRWKGMRLGLGEGLAGRAAQRRRAVMMVGAAGATAGSFRGRTVRGLSARAALAVPLLSRGRVIGVIEVVNRPVPQHTGEEQAGLISFLLEPAAVALDNALLLRKSEELSITDDLTKLYNSRFLNATLRREVERSRRYRHSVSLIFLDLDGFKAVNDQHGHISGSRTLVEVGAVIRATVREVDVVSRFGGDEFTVILPQTGPEGAVTIAERIRVRLCDSVFLQGYGLKVRLSASLGIASYPDHGCTKDDLIARADQAMYLAKSRGKNGVTVAVAKDLGPALAKPAV